MPRRDFKAVGITCGIGSMLQGARSAGFKVVGNVEWRKYYHAVDEAGMNTFLENFGRDTLFPHSADELTPQQIERMMEADIALGHPECGNFSQLNANREAVNDPGDIPLFCDLVGRFKPRFFVMDDLPKSFIAFPMAEYHRRLPDYDLFPEWVSNWGYGNTQRARNRFFMLGALKRERWTFVPGEQPHEKTVADVIGDLEGMEGNFPNHDRHSLQDNCAKGLHLHHHGHRATWAEMRDYILNSVNEGGPIHYHGPDGREMIRVGSYKGHWHGPAHVLTGGISGFHPLRGLPYTIRERARLQGFPDDFVFYGTRLDYERGQRVWNHDANMHMVRQTGKAMPVQFCTYVSERVMDHLVDGFTFGGPALNTRTLQPNEYVTTAKQWYCQNIGYANQKAACQSCWLAHGCDIRKAKHIPMPAEPARLLERPTRSRNVPDDSIPVTPSLSRNRSNNNNISISGGPESTGNGTAQQKSKRPVRTYAAVPTRKIEL